MANVEAFFYRFSPWSLMVLGPSDAMQVPIALWRDHRLGWAAAARSISMPGPKTLCVCIGWGVCSSAARSPMFRCVWSIICIRINILACHVSHRRNSSDFPAHDMCNSPERIADVYPNANILSAVWTLISRLKLSSLSCAAQRKAGCVSSTEGDPDF